MPEFKIKFGVGSSAFQQGTFGEFGESDWTLDANKPSFWETIFSCLNPDHSCWHTIFTCWDAFFKVPKTTIETSYWDIIFADLNTMAKMGVKTYRISIERSFIEPRPGVYDAAALKKYESLIDACQEKNMDVMLTLHHFVHPGYAADGFSNKNNIPPFVAYCEYVFKRFSAKVYLWCTLNEPGVEAFSHHLLGSFPPHNHMRIEQAVHVLRNTMQAHMDVYKALKRLDKGNNASIGIVHNILRFKALYEGYDCLSSTIANSITPYTDDLIMEFLNTGMFKHSSYPEHTYINNEPKGDFFGLNFYANPIVGPNLTNGYGATCRTGQRMGDMYLPIDPDGFQDAITRASRLNLPVYITETGIADKKDALRPIFLIKYLRVVVNALADGKDIREFIVWTFRDNYEWNEGNNKCFGLFEEKGKPRPSAHLYERLMKHMQRILADDTLGKTQVILQLHALLDSAETFTKQNDFHFEDNEIGTYEVPSEPESVLKIKR